MAVEFHLWSQILNVFETSSGPINGDLWDVSNIDDGGDPIVVDDATSASGYTAGATETYTIYLTSQDWLLTEQPAIVVAMVSLVLPGNEGSANLAAATIFQTSGNTGTGAVLYWKASTTSGDYALEFQPITTTYVSAPSMSPNTVLSGSPTTLLSAVGQPGYWDFATFGATSSQAAEVAYLYTTPASSATENVYLFGVTPSGQLSTSRPVLAATVADGTWLSMSTSSSDASFNLSYGEVGGPSGTGLYNETFDPFTGALGAASLYLSLPGYSKITSENSNSLSSGEKLRFHEGVLTAGNQAVIQDTLGDGAPSAITTIDLSSANDHYSLSAVDDPLDGHTDYTVLAYSDGGKVHLDLFNASGQRIGDDFVVPGISSFDRIHTLSGGDNARVELDYTVADPSGGQEVGAYVYDTAQAAYVYTLGGGGNGEYVGTTFDDTVTDAAGNYVVDGGGGADTFVVPEDADETLLSVDASGNLVVTTYDETTFLPSTQTGVATLRRFSKIKLNDADVVLTTAGDEATATISGDGVVEWLGGTPQSWTLALAVGATLMLDEATWEPINATSARINLVQAQASVTGGGDLIDFAGGSNDAVSLYGTDGAWDGVEGQVGTIYLTSAQTSVEIGGEFVEFAGGSGNAVGFVNTYDVWGGVGGSGGMVYLSNAQTTVTGGGDTIDFSEGSGDAVGLYSTSGAWDGVTGSDGVVYLTNAQTTVTGDDDSIDFSGETGNAVGLYSTNNQWDSVSGSGGVVYLEGAQATVTGGGDTIYLDGKDDTVALSATGNNWDTVSGSNGIIYMNGAQASVSGGADQFYLLDSAGNAVSLYDTNGAWDNVAGFQGATVYLTSAQAFVDGLDDTIYFSGGSGDAVDVSNWDEHVVGSQGVIYSGPGTTVAGGADAIYFQDDQLDTPVTLSGTNGAWDGVFGSGGAIYLASAQTTVAGQADAIYLSGSGDALGLSGTNEDWDGVSGSGATIYLSSAQTAVTGGGDAMYLSGTGDAVGLYGTNGTWDGVSGADSTVYLTSAQTTVSGGGGDTVNFSGGSGNAVGLSGTAASADTVNGSKGTVYVQGSQATINGGDDALYLSGSSTATISGSSDAFVFQQGIGGLDKVGGFGATDSMQFSHLDFATWAALQSDTTQAGSNAVITLNASDSVTILGVQKTSLAETQFHLV